MIVFVSIISFTIRKGMLRDKVVRSAVFVAMTMVVSTSRKRGRGTDLSWARF